MFTTSRLALLILALNLFAGRPGVAAESEQVFATGNYTFALDLYAQLKANDGNLFFSPYSISTCLTMVYTGAHGDTATEMARTLHFGSGPDEVANAFGTLQRRLTRGTNGYELNIANGLWGQQGQHFLPPFLDLASRQFEAKLNQVDFRTQSESARAEINDWVSQATKGKITDLIQRGVLNPLTRLVLVNAIYFKGEWAAPFKKEQTSDQPFSVTPENKVTVALMHREEQFNYAEADGLQLLELPYANLARPVSGQPSATNESLSMVVVLPREIGGLKKLEASLNKSALDNWLAQRRPQKVQVFLPKFKMASQFSLAPTLGAMGMTKPFTREADFSGMDGARDLFLSAVVHKACVDVNEEGTEAAAATAGVVRDMAVRKAPPAPVFRADHPFIFLIRDMRSGAILFMGRVTDPTK